MLVLPGESGREWWRVRGGGRDGGGWEGIGERGKGGRGLGENEGI